MKSPTFNDATKALQLQLLCILLKSNLKFKNSKKGIKRDSIEGDSDDDLPEQGMINV